MRYLLRYTVTAVAVVLLGALIACAPAETPTEAVTEAPPSLAGTWRAVLDSPGGELPFTLRFTDGAEGPVAEILNGDEETPTSRVEQNGSQVIIHIEWYDSEITADLDGDRMTGTWRRTNPGEGNNSTLPFTATRGSDERFVQASAELVGTADATAVESVSGDWAVEFVEEDGSTEPARGEFTQEGSRVTGTFLTPTGDYRFLEGIFEQGLLRLSTFDGAHAFLFVARVQPDGTLAGDFWSRDTYHATWTARPATEDDGDILPDSWSQAGLTNAEGNFHFEFPDLEGTPVSSEDPRFDGKVVIVNIFGTWCPNCNDEAPFLAQWAKRYRDQGLEIVGLAYEFSGNPERDGEMVRRFADRHGVDYTLLLAGINDKEAAGATLPDLTAVIAYPTSIFIGRDGKVRKIHSGFSGPGTGEHHTRLIAEQEALIENLLSESAPSV